MENKSRFFKQYKIKGVGAIWDTTIYTAFFVSLGNFVLLGITAWSVYVSGFISKYMPWLQLWMFLFVCFLVFIMLGLITYKFIIPSYYQFRQKQYSSHGENKQIAELQEHVQSLENLLERVLLER